MDFMVFEKKPEVNIHAFNTELVTRINTNTRRVRTLEQRHEGTEGRISSLEEKVIDELENLKKHFDQISTDIDSLTKNISELRAEFLKMSKSIEKSARKTEVKELESLIDLYNPIKSRFITREEVDKIIEERLAKKI